MLNHYEFDASELSLASYIIARSMGRPLIAIPVFPARAFRHSYVFVNTKSGITEPKDLEGKRVGIAEFQQTATVWMRGILREEYGVRLEKIQWLLWEEHGRMDIALPKQYQVDHVPAQGRPDEMLISGELDAIIHATIFPSLLSASSVRRLFPNYKIVEAEYYRKTGIFPIMHTVAMREELWNDCPWIAVSLYKAFEQAKAIAYRRLDDKNAYNISMVWFREPLMEQREILGDDPWAYGLKRNRNVVDTLKRYLFEEGLIPNKMPIENLFAANTVGL